MTIKTVFIAGVVALMPVAAQAEWQERIEIDRITEERLSAGIGSVTLAEEPRLFPLNLVPGRIYLDCDGSVMFSFNDEILFGTVLESPIEFSPRDELSVRARVGDRVAEFHAENYSHDQSRALIFFGTGADSLYSAVVNAGKLLLEIPTVEYGDLYFSYSLAGTRDLHDRTCGTVQFD